MHGAEQARKQARKQRTDKVTCERDTRKRERTLASTQRCKHTHTCAERKHIHAHTRTPVLSHLHVHAEMHARTSGGLNTIFSPSFVVMNPGPRVLMSFSSMHQPISFPQIDCAWACSFPSTCVCSASTSRNNACPPQPVVERGMGEKQTRE